MTNCVFDCKTFSVAIGLMIAGYVILLILALHNLIVYIIKEQRFRGPSLQLVVFYGLTIPFLIIQIGSCSVFGYFRRPGVDISETINLVSAMLMLLIGVNYIMMMNQITACMQAMLKLYNYAGQNPTLSANQPSDSNFTKKFIIACFISFVFLIPNIWQVQQLWRDNTHEFASKLWYWLALEFFVCGIILVEESIRSIYYMNKVAEIRGRTVKQEFPDQFRHLISLGVINLISFFGYGVWSILILPDSIKSDQQGDELKMFLLLVGNELLDFLIIGYPAFMHVKNFSAQNDSQSSKELSQYSQMLTNNLIESDRSNITKVTKDFYQNISQVSPENDSSFAAEVERLSKESSDRDSFSSDVIQALGLIPKNRHSFSNGKKLPNFGCKNLEAGQSLDSHQTSYLYKSQNNRKSEENQGFQLSERLMGPNN